MALSWYEKPHVFKRYGLWMMTAPGVALTRHLRWEHAMREVDKWWER